MKTNLGKEKPTEKPNDILISIDRGLKDADIDWNCDPWPSFLGPVVLGEGGDEGDGGDGEKKSICVSEKPHFFLVLFFLFFVLFCCVFFWFAFISLIY